MQKTVGRYQRVAGELSRWAPELTHAQTESVRALEKAEAARAANTVMLRPGDPPLSPDEQARERRRRAALDDATQDLAAAQRQLDDALEHATSEGRRYAGRIDDAINDDVADSWWDSVKDWVHRNAGWIKTVTDILSWVATALAVVALFIPGVNILAILAIGLTAAVLAGHTALALSGDGSWADVALDVFALATFGAGSSSPAASRVFRRRPARRARAPPHERPRAPRSDPAAPPAAPLDEPCNVAPRRPPSAVALAASSTTRNAMRARRRVGLPGRSATPRWPIPLAVRSCGPATTRTSPGPTRTSTPCAAGSRETPTSPTPAATLASCATPALRRGPATSSPIPLTRPLTRSVSRHTSRRRTTSRIR